MNQDNKTLTDCLKLLKDVLLDAFKVSVIFLTPPYEDIAKIDMGMRAAVWTNYTDDNTKMHFLRNQQQSRILIVKSNLGFYNVLIIFEADTFPDFISIGPFRDEELSPNYFAQILKESHIAPVDAQSMRHIYESMPLVLVDAVVNVAKHIITVFFPQFKDIVPEMLQYSEQNRAVDVNRDLLDNYSIEYAEQYQESLFSFLGSIKCGDTDNSKRILQDLIKNTNIIGNKSMRDYKMLLLLLNDFCHMELLHTSVHPLHIIKLTTSLRTKIEDTTSSTKLEQIPNEICRKYCLLIKNYANPDSSRLTKDVISYIQLHMEEELSLSHLADHFHKNPSVLSNTFSKETGQTLTKFIQQTRVHEAVRLFNTTNLSVSEVAMIVGYPDFSYFSKVFSKIIGYSPREYKQQNFINVTSDH